jgi:hypothetical protein
MIFQNRRESFVGRSARQLSLTATASSFPQLFHNPQSQWPVFVVGIVNLATAQLCATILRSALKCIPESQKGHSRLVKLCGHPFVECAGAVHIL